MKELKQLSTCDFCIVFQLTPQLGDSLSLRFNAYNQLFFILFFPLLSWTKRRNRTGLEAKGRLRSLWARDAKYYIIYMWRTWLLFHSWLIAVISLSFWLRRLFSWHTGSCLEKKNLKKIPSGIARSGIVDAAAVAVEHSFTFPRVLNDFRRPRLFLLSLALSHKI